MALALHTALALPLPCPALPCSALPCPVSGHLHDLRMHFTPVHSLPMAVCEGLDLAILEQYDAFSPNLSEQPFRNF